MTSSSDDQHPPSLTVCSYDNKGCGRSYLSQRDLEAHITYRHKDKSSLPPAPGGGVDLASQSGLAMAPFFTMGVSHSTVSSLTLPHTHTHTLSLSLIYTHTLSLSLCLSPHSQLACLPTSLSLPCHLPTCERCVIIVM